MKRFVIAAKPAAPLNGKAKRTLTSCQNDLKWRLKSYKQGRMQGLPMIFDNMMQMIKEQHEKAKINA